MPSATLNIDIRLPTDFDLGRRACTCKKLPLVSCTIDEPGRRPVAVRCRMHRARRERNAQTEPPPSISSADMASSPSPHSQEPATQVSPRPTTEERDVDGRDSSPQPCPSSAGAHYALVPRDGSTPAPPIRTSRTNDEADASPLRRPSPYWSAAHKADLWRRLEEHRRSGMSLDDAIHDLQNQLYPLLPPSDYTIPEAGLYESFEARLRRSYAPPRRAVRKRRKDEPEPFAKPASKAGPGWVSILWDAIQLSPRKRKLERDTEEDDDMTLVAPSDSEEDGPRGGKRRKL